MFWLLAPAPHEAAPPLSRLPAVRRDFDDALVDVGGPEACRLRQRIALAQSLRELWHLRTDLFRVVAICHDQAEATRRLGHLNRHFPTRSPRSQFGAL